jgi:hypothetical protein
MASVCPDLPANKHREAKPHLAFSAQITGTQRSQHTLEVVNVHVNFALDRC